MPGTCHATCPDGERGLGFQSPWAGSLDLPSDKERCEVSWGRDGGQPVGRGCFFVCFVLFCLCQGPRVSSGSCHWGPWLSFFLPCKEAIWEVRMKTDQTRTSFLRF